MLPEGKIINHPVEELKGVGPKVSESLSQLGIKNIQDALFHLPYRYEDRTKLTNLGEAPYETPVLIEGEIIKSTVVFRGRRMLFTEIYDGTGRLTIRMFHFAMAQHKALKQGSLMRCYGTIRHGSTGKEMIHPQYQVFQKSDPLEIDKNLTPVYASTSKLQQGRLKKIISSAINYCEKNNLLKDKTCWELNMLWNEKTHFVEHVYKNKIFDTKWYGWCDIGYFRGRPCDMNINLIKLWPNYKKLNELDKEKIHYGNVNGDMQKTYQIYRQIMIKNSYGLPTVPIPPSEIFIAAGFFIIYNDNILWWNKTHDDKLKLYFEHDYLVKDDQMIVLDNIVSNIKKVKIHTEFSEGKYDNWFMFQRLLM